MENMEIYNKLRSVPQEALKTIGAGRLKGMSDINPMWRIKALTENFGMCGFGWKYEITKQWTEAGAENEVRAFCNINLYVKVDGEWSAPIPGTGGSSFVTMERNGVFVSDECIDGECEILTRTGWVKFEDYSGEDEMVQYDEATRELSFVKPIRFIHKRSSDLYDRSGIIMTAHHRNLLVSHCTGRNTVLTAEELAQKASNTSRNGYGRLRSYRDIKCGCLGAPRELTPIQKLGILIACDGTLYRENKDGKRFWRLEFSKKRKIVKAEQILKEASIEYTKCSNHRKNGETTSFVFSLDGEYKIYGNFIPLGNYPHLWEEILQWDGCNGTVETFCTTNRENAMYLQTLFALSNQVVSVKQHHRSNPAHSDVYLLYRKKHSTCASGIRKVDGEMDVYCVEVPTSFFLVRKNNEIYVTGNCAKMALTDALSVACKALGVAADIYFANDRTKYTDVQPTARQQKPQTAENISFAQLDEQEQPKEYKCAECGKPFEPFTDKKGKTWSAAVVASMAKNNNTDGVARCRECSVKLGTRKEKQ